MVPFNFKFAKVKKGCKIYKVNSILSIFGLVLLFLLSPCKVRNYIQSELGIPQTKVLNKSQSTISQSNCLNFDVFEIVQSVSKLTIQQPDLFVYESFNFGFTPDLLNLSFYPISSRNQTVSVIPLYILYQNFKVYS